MARSSSSKPSKRSLTCEPGRTDRPGLGHGARRPQWHPQPLAVALTAGEDLYGDEVALIIEYLQTLGATEQTERLAEFLDGCVTLVLASRRVELDAGVDVAAIAEELEHEAETLLRRRR
jgi:hypothetical protein